MRGGDVGSSGVAATMESHVEGCVKPRAHRRSEQLHLSVVPSEVVSSIVRPDTWPVSRCEWLDERRNGSRWTLRIIRTWALGPRFHRPGDCGKTRDESRATSGPLRSPTVSAMPLSSGSM